MNEKPVQTYQDLKVWQAAMDLAEAVYRTTAHFPNSETYGLTAQMRRSAVSVASNIAEGFGRENRGSFVQFLRIGQGSLKELETQAILANRIGYIEGPEDVELKGRCEEVGKMLRSLIRSVQSKQAGE